MSPCNRNIGAMVEVMCRSEAPVCTMRWKRLSIQAIGFLVPGLIASWMDRQGFAVTLGSMITVAILARLALLLIARV